MAENKSDNLKETSTLSENLLANDDKKRSNRNTIENSMHTTQEIYEEVNKMSVNTLRTKRTRTNYCFFILLFGGFLSLAWLIYGIVNLCNFGENHKGNVKGWFVLIGIWIVPPVVFFVGFLIGLIFLYRYKKKVQETIEIRPRKKTNLIKKYNII